MKVTLVPTQKLVMYGRNPRVNDHAVAKMVKAIQNHGFLVPVLAQKDNTIIDGHLRYKAALEMGEENVPVIYVTGLSKPQIKALRISINRMAELGEWNEEKLKTEFEWFKDNGFDLETTSFSLLDIENIINPPQFFDDMDMLDFGKGGGGGGGGGQGEGGFQITFNLPVEYREHYEMLLNHSYRLREIALQYAEEKLAAGA